MSNKSFLEIPRVAHVYRPVAERQCDYNEVEAPLDEAMLRAQAERCMNCGTPFCHGYGCPLGNPVPDFNACVVRGDWRGAWELLSSSSDFPEFMSRVCPALCEGSCTCGLVQDAVMVRQLEKAIVERAYAEGWVRPLPAVASNGRRAAVIGSGPAGLSAALTLYRKGFAVTVFEKDAAPGGLLRYGIPDFKLSKRVIDRKLQFMKDAGIRFECQTEIGKDISGEYLARNFDVVMVTVGSPIPRDLKIPGRELSGVHFALELLQGQNRANAGLVDTPPVDTHGKRVLVIGGGDTGSDCVGTAHRQGALSVTQIEIMPRPPEQRAAWTPWPTWPMLLRTSSSHEEGCVRRWNLNSLRFLGDAEGKLTGVEVIEVVKGTTPEGRPTFTPAPGAKPEVIPCEVALLAMGFLKFDRAATLERYGLPDCDRVYVAGDAANGPSLVVRAIVSGRDVAEKV